MNRNEVDILLVDDSQDDVDLTLHSLRAENLANRVFVVRDGEEALDFLFCTGPYAERSFNHPPKLVLLDLKLPKIDGMQVLKRVKRDERTRGHPGCPDDFLEGRTRSGNRLQPRGQQLSAEAG